jgi:hypothetical protein
MTKHRLPRERGRRSLTRAARLERLRKEAEKRDGEEEKKKTKKKKSNS